MINILNEATTALKKLGFSMEFFKFFIPFPEPSAVSIFILQFKTVNPQSQQPHPDRTRKNRPRCDILRIDFRVFNF